MLLELLFPIFTHQMKVHCYAQETKQNSSSRLMLNFRLVRSAVPPIVICHANEVFTDLIAADAINFEFSQNFASAEVPFSCVISSLTLNNSQLLNCSKSELMVALKGCANTAIGPDSPFYSTIKKIILFIKYPLLVIF